MARTPSSTLLLLLLPFGCADYELSKDQGAAPMDSGWEADADADGDSDEDDPSDDDGYGNETEDDYAMLAPAATDAYVFVANPERDTVTRISVPSLEVITTKVGTTPTYAETTSDYAKAITFNTGSDDLSIIDAETLEVENVEVRPNLNAMAVSPSGVWVICFHDADLEDTSLDDEGGSQSFNTISLVNTDTMEHFAMVVGQNPRQVKYTDDSSLALVVSDESVALLDLTALSPSPEMISVSDDPLDAPQAEEIEVSPRGDFAFLRQYGATEILILDLITREVGTVEVGDNPTDLDITPDGASAVVVARASQELWLLSTADPYAEPVILDLPEDEVLGSVLLTPDGTTGILYTTAVLTPHYAIWDIATGEMKVQTLVKPVKSIAASPVGGTLLVLHTQEDAADGSTEEQWQGAWAVTPTDISSFPPRYNPLKLDAEPTAWAQSDDGDHGFFIMDGQPYLESIDYHSLVKDEVRLDSVPSFVGALPDSTLAYVSQVHDLGRISFYDTQDGSLETITGFELNSEIEH